MKLCVFEGGKPLKIIKIITLVFSGILLFWFTFDITGLKFGDTKVVISAFVSEPIDFVFYLVYIASIIWFVLKDKIGKYVLAFFLFLWGTFQFTVYLKRGENILAYNKIFADTHRIIAVSDEVLVKDTYHIFLDIFIFLALITAIIFLVTKIIWKRKNRKG